MTTLIAVWMSLTISPLARAEDAPVSLPPMVVESRTKPLAWRYYSLPGLELISVCSDATTEEFLRRHHRIEELLQLILPAKFQARTSTPETHLLFDETVGRARSREVIAEMVRVSRAKMGKGGRLETQRAKPPWMAPNASRVQFMPNLRLADGDAVSVFTATGAGEDDEMIFSFRHERIAWLLERRVPALPAWFVAGVAEVYRRARLEDGHVTLMPHVWISDEESLALLQEAERTRVLLPLEELFTRQPPRRGRELTELDRVWLSQCALFVRWAIASGGRERAQALWTLVERLENEAMNEALFESCFGLGFSDARDRLSDWLSRAVREEATLRPERLSRPPRLAGRPATDLEVARIRGEWERMEIAFVKERFPELAERYVEQARTTLRRAYDRGERDARLLASLGLTEIDAGNPADAREFLEAAAAERVRRPRVYLELARLRLADVARAPDAQLSREEVARVVEPLLASRGFEPPLAEAFALMADVWDRSAEPSRAEDLGAIAEIAKFFPGESWLMLRAIHLHAVAGDMAGISRLLEIGTRHAREPRQRERFVNLTARIAGAANPP